VRYELLDKQYGYIRISQFQEKTDSEFEKALKEHPEIVVQLIKTHIKASNYAMQNLNETADIYAKRNNAKVEDIRASLRDWDGSFVTDPNATVTIKVGSNVCCSCSPYPKFTYTKLPYNGTYPVQFTDISTGPKGVQWYWNFGDGTSSTLQNPLKTYSRSGSYTVIFYMKWVDCSGKTSTYWVTNTQIVKVP
jgi:PKD repeat protein